ncbi:MAG: aminotransferase class I/II-fold pyridoxal phosphate-dependent enzyme [bacterium]|nr:aminotransferase class I/II-fold pyridoxal phosphate-dependent enzyme [bacterium]
MIASNRINRFPEYMFAKINSQKLAARRKGIDIIDLGMGNPDHPTPVPVVQALVKAVQDTKTHRYSVARGIYNFRREASRFYERKFNVSIDPDKEVVALIGTKEGLAHLMFAILNEGDSAVVPNPTYPIHMYGVIMAGGNLINVPLFPFDTFLQRMSDTIKNTWPQPKILILNFPNNPTTLSVELGFFEEVVAVARKHNLLVVHDMAYADIVFDDYVAPSILQVKGAKEIAIEFYSFSKSFNMPGWRVGFACGNAEIVQALTKIKSYLDYGIFTPIQIAGIKALQCPEAWIKQNSDSYSKRADIAVKEMNKMGWPVEKPRGTMYLWPAIPEKFKNMSAMDFSMMLLEKAEVAVSPGVGFGEYGEGYVRIALVENENRIRQALKNIKKLM